MSNYRARSQSRGRSQSRERSQSRDRSQSRGRTNVNQDKWCHNPICTNYYGNHFHDEHHKWGEKLICIGFRVNLHRNDINVLLFDSFTSLDRFTSHQIFENLTNLYNYLFELDPELDLKKINKELPIEKPEVCTSPYCNKHYGTDIAKNYHSWADPVKCIGKKIIRIRYIIDKLVDKQVDCLDILDKLYKRIEDIIQDQLNRQNNLAKISRKIDNLTASLNEVKIDTTVVRISRPKDVKLEATRSNWIPPCTSINV